MAIPHTTRTPSARTVILVVATFVLATTPHILAMPIWLGATILLAAAWRVAAALKNWRPPNRIIRVGFTFLALGLVVVAFGALWGRRAATAMLCVMMAAKLLEMFRLRDARVIAALSFFLVATQFLFSQRLELLAWLLATCWLATAALMQIQRDEDGAESAARKPEISGRKAIRQTIGGGLTLMMLALPFALALFVLFPRLSSPLWGLPERALDGRTGLSDEMVTGMIATLYADDSPAFRVTFDGPVPERSELYWRGPVLWRLDGRTWRRLYYSNRPPERLPEVDPSAWRYSVQIEPNERNWLFALDYPVRWPSNAELNSDFELVRDEPVTTVTRYEMTSQPDFTDTPDLMRTLRAVALDIPENSNPRTRDYAQELRRQYPDDRELIEAVLDWFNEDEFFYSLETAPLGRDGADEFLFDLKTGYCEYYASAFVILMRAAGIPSRIVTGYQGGFWQNNDEYLLVRQSDAHAWAEVWLEGSGWTRIDPTAAVSPSRILEGTRGSLPPLGGWLDAEWVFQLRNQYDRIQNVWNRWVLGFDSGRQRNMLARLGLDALGLAGQGVLIILAAGMLIVPLAFLIRGLNQPGRDRAPAVRAWVRIERRLRRAGIIRNPGETTGELTRRAALQLLNGPALVHAASLFERLRYGPSTDANGLAELQQMAREWRPLMNSTVRSAVEIDDA